ncbi:hypothetical protein [Sphingobium lignivorans]|uniref:ParB/Sulfiredoxin domain-containing protein n=1 Tax=Sphingobium lignivorans TaxID=2735886 RepID=A0ABR6NKS1_9SPHN|nr:hypothetical protein [Sphingobium lignivorans]MBB5987872.1 hypothetical protein [Sphingobium lignivorans]
MSINDQTKKDLGKPFDLELDKIALDPNNPRIAPKPAPGYANAKTIFDPEVQSKLVVKVYETYNAGDLEASIIEQGWTPVDQILVWEHPSGEGHIVVEGNTRVSLLKRLPERLDREQKKLDRLIKSGSPQSQIHQQELLIKKIEQLIADTRTLTVYPVLAADATELRLKLPRLLGVRHVMPAKGWGPYATNLYIISLYESAYYDKHGEDEPLRLEQPILDRIAAELPLKPDQIRKNIQAVSAFSHFKANYEEQIEAAGNKLGAGDQYYFDNILASTHARNEFGFTPDRLQLTDEGEEALFKWAFSKKRETTGDDPDAINENVFQKAEDIRLWQKIARYDAKTGTTNFSRRLSISEPDDATPVWRLNREADSHREQNTPVKALNDLLNGLKQIKLDTLLMQGEHIKPMMEEAVAQIQKFVKFIDDNRQ